MRKLTDLYEEFKRLAESANAQENEILEGAALDKKSGKSKSGGLNEKGRKSYERENPGSDLKAQARRLEIPVEHRSALE